VLLPCASGRADWAWDFYNSDGGSAEMCGNGARCFARFARQLAGAKDNITFETRAGIITASFSGRTGHGGLDSAQGFAAQPDRFLAWRQNHPSFRGHRSASRGDVCAGRGPGDGAIARRGNPGHAHFAPRGTNVNFVELRGAGAIRVRTYERGVEGETLACGTGVTAAALISAELHQLTSPVRVQVRSGDLLEVSFEKKGGQFANVRLAGPADFVFEGRIAV